MKIPTETLIKELQLIGKKKNKYHITPAILRKAAKLLMKYKVPKPYYVEVDDTTEKYDFS